MDYKEKAKILRALAHPARMKIAEILMEGQKCVNEIKEIVGLRQPNVSQHLTILKSSDIADFKKVGNSRCYYLKNSDRVKKILNCLK